MGESSRFLLKLADSVLTDAAEREAFVDALSSPKDFPHSMILIDPAARAQFALEARLPWQVEWVERLAVGERPGAHKLHEQGAFYLLDFSSVFAVSAVDSLKGKLDTIMDLCASPGGKSVYLWKAHSPGQLLSNEVIAKRTGALISNLKRCGVTPVLVNSQDTSVIAQHQRACADLVVVDAPCSGQSLLAKGTGSPGCFHPSTINMNANRQRRILANASESVASGGHLLYSTCTYSKKENEGIIEWFTRKFPDFAAVEVDHLSEYRSALSDLPCYRLWPQSQLGAGAFTCLLRYEGERERAELDERALRIFWRSDLDSQGTAPQQSHAVGGE